MRELNVYEVSARVASAYTEYFGDGTVAYTLDTCPRDDAAAVSLLSVMNFCFVDLLKRGFSADFLVASLIREDGEPEEE